MNSKVILFTTCVLLAVAPSLAFTCGWKCLPQDHASCAAPNTFVQGDVHCPSGSSGVCCYQDLKCSSNGGFCFANSCPSGYVSFPGAASDDCPAQAACCKKDTPEPPTPVTRPARSRSRKSLTDHARDAYNLLVPKAVKDVFSRDRSRDSRSVQDEQSPSPGTNNPSPGEQAPETPPPSGNAGCSAAKRALFITEAEKEMGKGGNKDNPDVLKYCRALFMGPGGDTPVHTGRSCTTEASCRTSGMTCDMRRSGVSGRNFPGYEQALASDESNSWTAWMAWNGAASCGCHQQQCIRNDWNWCICWVAYVLQMWKKAGANIPDAVHVPSDGHYSPAKDLQRVRDFVHTWGKAFEDEGKVTVRKYDSSNPFKCDGLNAGDIIVLARGSDLYHIGVLKSCANNKATVYHGNPSPVGYGTWDSTIGYAVSFNQC